MPLIYLAGPLFSLAEQEFNQRLHDELVRLRPNLEVILPQQRAKSLLKKENGLELIFQDCLQMVVRSEAVIAILDGPDSDSGTCVELGYAHAHHKPIVGVRTDFRGSEDRGLNLMVSHLCTSLVTAKNVSINVLAAEIIERVERLLPQTQNGSNDV